MSHHILLAWLFSVYTVWYRSMCVFWTNTWCLITMASVLESPSVSSRYLGQYHLWHVLGIVYSLSSSLRCKDRVGAVKLSHLLGICQISAFNLQMSTFTCREYTACSTSLEMRRWWLFLIRTLTGLWTSSEDVPDAWSLSPSEPIFTFSWTIPMKHKDVV